MAEVYVGQVMMTGFPFAPKSFAQCSGAQLPIRQNMALFALLGTVYGGDGINNFNLPDLRGRTPVGGGFPSADTGWQPPLYTLGQAGGVEQVSLTADQNPGHTHQVAATSAAATLPYPESGMTLAVSDAAATVYGPATALVPLGAGPTSQTGSGAPHPNMQPFQTINFNIALTGIFPSRP